MDAIEVEEAAERLYGLPLEEFVAARDSMTKQAKSSGAAQAAKQIKAFRKPTLAAWLANQLVREHRDAVDELATVGDAMREAAAARDGTRLRELTADRRRLVGALLERTRALARERRIRIGEDVAAAVEETLLAAVADPDAAGRLRAGRLARPLRHVGFGPMGSPAASTSPPVPAGTTERRAAGEGDDELARKRDEREREAAAAAVTAAEARVETVTADVRRNTEARTAAEATVGRLTTEIDRLRAEIDRLDAELATAHAELDRASADAQGAQEELDRARAELADARRRRRTVEKKQS